MENYLNSMDDLDLSCLYEEKNPWDNFEKKEIKNISIQFFYIKTNELIFIKKISFPVQENKISLQQINELYQKNKIYKNEKYFLDKILQYHFSLDQKEIPSFLKTKPISFLKIIPITKSIYFEPSIYFFHQVNELFFLLKSKTPIKKNKTKKSIETIFED